MVWANEENFPYLLFSKYEHLSLLGRKSIKIEILSIKSLPITHTVSYPTNFTQASIPIPLFTQALHTPLKLNL